MSEDCRQPERLAQALRQHHAGRIPPLPDDSEGGGRREERGGRREEDGGWRMEDGGGRREEGGGRIEEGGGRREEGKEGRDEDGRWKKRKEGERKRWEILGIGKVVGD